MAFGAFSKNSGPSGTSRPQPVFSNVSISTTSPQTPKVFALDNDAPPPQRSPSSYNGGIKSATEFSPPLFSSTKVVAEDSHPNPSHGDRAAISPPKLCSRSNLWEKNASSQTQLKSALLSRIGAEGAKPKVRNSQVPKRTRSPPLASADEVLLGNSYSELDSEREMQAKAKRLARFGVELSQPVQSNYDPMKQKSSGNRHDQALVERRKIAADQSIEATGDFMSTDYDGLEPSSVIIGLCPDMCPESERDERERKGDLDKYERLDGDRNLTSKSLAVKKYNRMAEREADLIRPMPVLQKTMVYLLALLDQPYGDNFLGLYNFLWDRMRAIRMDLRMQHIFNHEAITMLEQMIRFHIIAMHELCEYTKGEGFSEGFDAHLNIEQMNKTSVELFQMYDDHKKNGISVASEKEFRGYYALLKLDKHPGYKVEPAELSLDLAKMSPEIRQTREILFARDVARACRTGNFIAFFRLAGKATYLQACLMHAHFAKLRTQAFASLHSGLQSNQGIPTSHITKWLGMEGEDIESLLEYHGFLIKEYEEPYMVKEGPFLNNDKDYVTKCSQLVHLKKSNKIIKDVSSIVELLEPADQAKQAFPVKIDKHKPPSACFVDVKEVFHADEEMTDHGKCTTPIDGLPVPPIFEMPFTTAKSVQGKTQAAEVVMSSVIVPSIYHFPQPTPAKVGKMGQMAHQTLRSNSLDKNILSTVPRISQETVAKGAPQIDCSDVSYIGSMLVNSAPYRVAVESKAVEGTIYPQNVGEKQAIIQQGMDNEEDVVVQHKNEVAMAKLKLILRIWKRRSSKQKEMREVRQLAASAALSSLSLGLPIRRINNNLGHVIELDIDHAMRERRERQGRSWSRLNISKVIAEILCQKNPGAKCLCWKLIFCSQMKSMKEDRLGYGNQVNSSASRWLFTKLMGASNMNDDGLAYSSPGLSIWKNWVSGCHDSSTKCCLSVVREIEHDNLCDIKGGANAILFLASESIPLELQKTQLHNILMSLPSGSNLPLLVVSDTYREQMLFDGLDLLSIDKTRLSSFTFLSLVENHPPGYLDGFFSNDRLVEGLQWLASQSRLQPVLRRVQTRDLVMDQLSSLLQVLENMNASVISPNQCISAFNEALHQSTEKVATVAEKIPGIWPCPEVYLLEESSDEHKVVESFLPSMGWFSIVTLESIISAIQGCMLPVFPDDLSWLNCGSDMGKEIHTQKSKLELCLFQYLADSSKIMDWTLAVREASVMVQKAARLELHGIKYRIIPRWLTIFKRIFQWRLMNLTAGAASVAYILETEGESCQKTCDFTPVKFCKREFSAIATSPWSEVSDNPKLEGDFRPPSALSQLSLDEMVEVCCSPILSGREQSKHGAFQPHSGINNGLYEAADVASGGEVTEEDGKMLEDRSFAESGDSLLSNCHHSAGRMIVTSADNRESDRLQKLLAQCNKLQDTIDAKLSIYF